MKYRTRRPNVPPYHWLYAVLQHSAKREEKTLNLTFEDFLTFTKNQKCFYCDAPILWYECSRYRDETGKLLRRSQAYYLDRKDNSKGYSIENCVVCCSRCNAIKGNTLNYEEMLLLREGLRKISILQIGRS
jgi:5-methylcytosine-specific restriction endonuclease McrA